jgi:small-conductance mechanosensitive channel/CRP-like cAMP-binding protein
VIDFHPNVHWWTAAGLVAVQVLLMVVVRNRAVRRRLLSAAAVAIIAAILHVVAREMPGVDWLGGIGARLERLLLAFSIGSSAIALLFNPWFAEGRSSRAPAIVQDALVVLFVAGAAAVVFSVSSFNVLTGSAIVAAIIGFALQETLGNAFAGIAIQIERPFRVGQWIAAGDHVGLVTEVTWRATKIRTKSGDMVIVPNSQMAAHAIHNYSEPTTPTRIEVEVGADYGTPPNDVREAMMAAVRHAKYVLATPPPDVVLADFGASAIVYRARFWIDDFATDGLARDAVRTGIYYEFRRRGIEIPWPIQVEYARQEKPADTPERRQHFKRAIASVPVLAGLPDEAHGELAAEAEERLFADGEVVVREGDSGASMFIVRRGRVAIAVGADRREVAVTDAGGYFGEMSLLTGEPRTATVIARGDCTVLEITAATFRAYIQANPGAIDQLASAAVRRRQELDQARAGSAPAAPPTAASLRARMLAFFGLAN